MYHQETLELELEKEEEKENALTQEAKMSKSLPRTDSDERINLAEDNEENESLIEERVRKESSQSNLSGEVILNLDEIEAKRL